MTRQLTHASIAIVLFTTWVSGQDSGSNYGRWEKTAGLEAYQFHTSKLRGTIVASDSTNKVQGAGHGLRGLVFLPTGKDLHPADKAPNKGRRRDGIFNLYRVYSKTTPLGALREEAAYVRQLVDGAELTWPANENRSVEIEAVWRITGPAQIDIHVVAIASKPLQNFEILLANYVALDMTKGVYVTGHEGPQLFWVRPSADYGDPENYPFFPLGTDARQQQQQSGRILTEWKWKSHVTAQDAGLPIAFADNGTTQIVLMGDPKSLSAICVTSTPSEAPPEKWNGMELHSALYCSLFCHDIAAGQRYTARARLIVLEKPHDSQLTHKRLYKEFLADQL